MPLRGAQRGRGTCRMGDTATTVKDMTAPTGNQKAEDPSRDGSTSSIASSPEPDPETFTQDHPQQQQKRKGGRKPVSSPAHSTEALNGSIRDEPADADQETPDLCYV